MYDNRDNKPIYTGKQIIWTKLYWLMKDNGLNNKSFSRALKEKGVIISHVSISRYITGVRPCPDERIKEFADFFDVQVEALG